MNPKIKLPCQNRWNGAPGGAAKKGALGQVDDSEAGTSPPRNKQQRLKEITRRCSKRLVAQVKKRTACMKKTHGPP